MMKGRLLGSILHRGEACRLLGDSHLVPWGDKSGTLAVPDRAPWLSWHLISSNGVNLSKQRKTPFQEIVSLLCCFFWEIATIKTA